MTDHDSETTSCRPTENRGDPREAAPDVALEVRPSLAEQGLHGLAAVVAGDVGMEVLPDALDAVGVGAVGRQEVEDDAVAELFHLSGEARHARLELVDTAHHRPEIGHWLRRLSGRWRFRRRRRTRCCGIRRAAERLGLKIADVALETAKTSRHFGRALRIGRSVEGNTSDQARDSDESNQYAGSTHHSNRCASSVARLTYACAAASAGSRSTTGCPAANASVDAVVRGITTSNTMFAGRCERTYCATR